MSGQQHLVTHVTMNVSIRCTPTLTITANVQPLIKHIHVIPIIHVVSQDARRRGQAVSDPEPGDGQPGQEAEARLARPPAQPRGERPGGPEAGAPAEAAQ